MLYCILFRPEHSYKFRTETESLVARRNFEENQLTSKRRQDMYEVGLSGSKILVL
jgi:hypothetical protein